ncbi:ABC transporter permease [Rhodococcus pyridinivorans]|uniref:ABC transporter permease n=1 Tax=Rhodococcus pyridinivorans TaxID=103816 RepID=UPI0022847B26|nr:ABC transporter permease [Rhodococcus pyridinivorans]WAL49503.1 ABC transporter permease [Rhodococcus pyridinivorans]
MTTAAVGRDARTEPQLVLRRLNDYLLPAMLIVMVVVFAALEPQFMDGSNLVNVARQSVFLLFITLGQMIVLIHAQLDLSVGATVAATSVLVATATREVVPAASVPVGLLVGLGAGVAIGLVNGAIVAFGRVPSFMATLGTTSVLTGLALIISNGAPVTGIPLTFSDILGTSRILGIPVSVLLGLATIAVIGLLLGRSRIGRDMYAIGGNAEAARAAGIDVRRTMLIGFVLCSVLAALAGVLLTARVGSGEASLGGSYVMLSIAAAVLGGTSLFGGEGKVWRVVVGVLFLGVLSNGMNLLHVSSYVQQLVIGAVLICAVGLERLREAT